MIIIVEEGEHLCPKCHIKMEAVIYANPNLRPKEIGNPWQCPKCKEVYGIKDGKTYWEHLQLVERKYCKVQIQDG